MKTITAYQTKDNRVFTSLEEAEDHEYYISLVEPNDFHLTDREQEVFNLLIKTDLQTVAIAEMVGVTPRTIKAFITKIYKKTEVESRIGLIIKHGN